MYEIPFTIITSPSKPQFDRGVKLIKNNYGELGDIGTEVFHPQKGKGMVFDNEGNIKWMDGTFNSNYRSTKPISFNFDKVITPIFIKDTDNIKSYNYDIRQIFADNPIKDIKCDVPAFGSERMGSTEFFAFSAGRRRFISVLWSKFKRHLQKLLF